MRGGDCIPPDPSWPPAGTWVWWTHSPRSLSSSAVSESPRVLRWEGGWAAPASGWPLQGSPWSHLRCDSHGVRGEGIVRFLQMLLGDMPILSWLSPGPDAAVSYLRPVTYEHIHRIRTYAHLAARANLERLCYFTQNATHSCGFELSHPIQMFLCVPRCLV